MEVENYWHDNAAKLKAELAHKGEDFIQNASMEEIEQCDVNVFLGLGHNEKSAILKTMRQGVSSMDDSEFWHARAAQLKAAVAYKGDNFLQTATPKEIGEAAKASGLDFKDWNYNMFIVDHKVKTTGFSRSALAEIICRTKGGAAWNTDMAVIRCFKLSITSYG